MWRILYGGEPFAYRRKGTDTITIRHCLLARGAARESECYSAAQGQRWLDLLRNTFRDSGYQIDWYCNQKSPRALSFDRADLEKDGIRLLEPIPESDLPAILSQYSYAIVPSDTLDGKSPPSVQAIAELSLPSRIPFMLATAHLPILVLGHPETSAARFVERFKFGAVIPYDADAVRIALERLSEPEIQSGIRHRAAALSASFSARGSADWIWRSLQAGEACDLIYEKLMPSSQAATFSGGN
jgi:hypothetical protein